MSTQQHSTPTKGDILINPKTNRPVQVGGRVWRKLVAEGVVNGVYRDTNQLAEIPVSQTDEGINKQRQELDKQLGPNYQAVRGRGQHRGKLVKRRRQPSTVNVAKRTVNKAIKTIKKNPEQEDEDELERLIMQELMNDFEPEPEMTKQPLKKQPEELPDDKYYECDDNGDFIGSETEEYNDYLEY